MNFLFNETTFQIYNEVFGFIFMVRQSRHNLVDIYKKLKNIKTYKKELFLEEFGTEITEEEWPYFYKISVIL